MTYRVHVNMVFVVRGLLEFADAAFQREAWLGGPTSRLFGSPLDADQCLFGDSGLGSALQAAPPVELTLDFDDFEYNSEPRPTANTLSADVMGLLREIDSITTSFAPAWDPDKIMASDAVVRLRGLAREALLKLGIEEPHLAADGSRSEG